MLGKTDGRQYTLTMKISFSVKNFIFNSIVGANQAELLKNSSNFYLAAYIIHNNLVSNV